MTKAPTRDRLATAASLLGAVLLAVVVGALLLPRERGEEMERRSIVGRNVAHPRGALPSRRMLGSSPPPGGAPAETSLASRRASAEPPADAAALRVGSERPGEPPVGPSSTGGPAPTSSSLLVRVVATEGGPIAGAVVLAVDDLGGRRRLGTTDAAGVHRLAASSARPPSALRIEAVGRSGRTVPVSRRVDELLVLLPPARSVAGRVVAAEDGAPLVGASVSAESATWSALVTSDLDGRFELADAPEGEALVLAVRHPTRVPVVVGEAAAATIRLERGLAVAGRVVDWRGAPVADAEVFGVGAGSLGAPRVARADRDGRFELVGIAPDERLALLAASPTHASDAALRWIDPSAGDDDGVTVVVAPRGALTITGAPPGRHRLEADGVIAPVPFLERRFAAAPDGVARVARLPAGRWRVVPEDGAAARGVVTIEAGAAATARWVELVEDARAAPDEPDGVIHVRVLDGAGRPVVDAVVTVAQGGATRSARTAADGTASVPIPSVDVPASVSAHRPGLGMTQPELVEPGGAGAVLVLR